MLGSFSYLIIISYFLCFQLFFNTGCANENLNILPPEELFHDEVPFHVYNGKY